MSQVRYSSEISDDSDASEHIEFSDEEIDDSFNPNETDKCSTRIVNDSFESKRNSRRSSLRNSLRSQNETSSRTSKNISRKSSNTPQNLPKETPKTVEKIQNNLNNYSYRESFLIESDSDSETDKNSHSSIKNSDSDDQVEIVPQSPDIIEVSSDEEIRPVKINPPKQTILNQFFQIPKQEVQSPKSQIENDDADTTQPIKIKVGRSVYNIQKEKVKSIENDVLKLANTLRTVNLINLPDKGQMLKEKYEKTKELLKLQKHKLDGMEIAEDEAQEQGFKAPSWNDIQAGVSAVQPKTFGKQALATYNTQKALTMERLQQLFGSLETCPKETDLAEDPKGLKVELMPHQKRALLWLMWRERQKPSGGILADDMGLGKTLTMISLMLKTKELESPESEEEDTENEPVKKPKVKGGTLVVCPASLINQWTGELERRTKRGLASFCIQHGAKRESNARRLAEYDMVVTTYSIVKNEIIKKDALSRIYWNRIVLDEAHQIRNHKSQTASAVFQLSGKYRWALTGTPVHNKELDMYSLLKFLKCSPFDDLTVWKKWVGDKTSGGQERLHAVMSSLLLRRTKAELMNKGALQEIPEKKWELIEITLEREEMMLYQKVLLFSRTLFAQYLHQKAEKNQDAVDLKFTSMPNNAPNEEYNKMREKILRMNKIREVSQHEILVLLLRLRQICCHPYLIKKMLNEEETEELNEETEEMNILDQLENLNLDETNYEPQTEGPIGLKEASKGFLNPSSPIFTEEHCSSKIGAALKVLKENVFDTDDKAVVVSQWPSMLHLLAYHLRRYNVKFDQLDGKVPVPQRAALVDNFNNPSHPMKIMLLSLTAGGVGLNLIGGNHLLLLDLHWNPQLENQAQDRIYRVGQKKPVRVYKFMAAETIEQRIKLLQEKKLDIAEAMLTGTKQVINSKLSLQDLKMLFDM